MSGPEDPIDRVPDNARELFARFGQLANGFSNEDVFIAAANLLINAIRQAHPKWSEAERAFDDKVGRTKQVLKDHYDSSGRLRGVFPYDQTISVIPIRRN